MALAAATHLRHVMVDEATRWPRMSGKLGISGEVGRDVCALGSLAPGTPGRRGLAFHLLLLPRRPLPLSLSSGGDVTRAPSSNYGSLLIVL